MQESHKHPPAISFEEVYRRYADRIVNLAFRMTGSEEVARDLTQDVFMRVYEKQDSFKGESGVFTWIYRIAVNHIYNYLKRRRRYRWLSLMDQKVGALIREEHLDSGNWQTALPEAADARMVRREREQAVWRLVLQLPEKYRVPLVLQRFEGLSHREISEAMGISISAVETRIHRARKELVRRLEPIIDQL